MATKFRKSNRNNSLAGKLALELIAVLGFLTLLSVSGNSNALSDQSATIASNGINDLASIAGGFMTDQWDRFSH